MDVAAENEQLKAELAARDAELAASRARTADLEGQVAKLTELVLELRARLESDSSNSNKPPSSDPPGKGAKKSKGKKGKRRRGGQKGHRGSHRELLPPELVDEFVDLFPNGAKTRIPRCACRPSATRVEA